MKVKAVILAIRSKHTSRIELSCDEDRLLSEAVTVAARGRLSCVAYNWGVRRELPGCGDDVVDDMGLCVAGRGNIFLAILVVTMLLPGTGDLLKACVVAARTIWLPKVVKTWGFIIRKFEESYMETWLDNKLYIIIAKVWNCIGYQVMYSNPNLVCCLEK